MPLQLGLVSRVTPHERLDEEVETTIKGVLQGDPEAIQETKRLLKQSLHVPFEYGLSSEAASFANCFERLSTEEDSTSSLRRHGGETPSPPAIENRSERL